MLSLIEYQSAKRIFYPDCARIKPGFINYIKIVSPNSLKSLNLRLFVF